MINKVLRVMFFVYIWPFHKLIGVKKVHRHVARVSTGGRLRVIHAYCIKCGKVTFRVWWPFWKWER